MIKEVAFLQILKRVMKHNDYKSGCVKVEQCDKIGRWTPCDLIIREHLNNGDGSAEGFLGITPNENNLAYEYIRGNKDYFIKQNMVNKDGYNNFGFPLWNDYDF